MTAYTAEYLALAHAITNDGAFTQALLDTLKAIRSIQKSGEVHSYEIVERRRVLAAILTQHMEVTK